MQKKFLVPTLIGNILEFYDYCLYAYFASVIAKLFFPSSDKSTALIAAFSVFAVGFLMRPLGAILFGYLGDRYGRKKTLAYGIILMASSTVFVGCLPTYATLGAFAIVPLVLCRLIQGLAVGGEFSGSLVYMIEHAGNKRRGMYSSLGIFSANVGVLFASCVATLISKIFSEPELYAWGWRVPFLLGTFLGVIGFYFRLKMPETPSFAALKESQTILQNPVRVAFQQNSFQILKGILLASLPALGSYVLFTFFPTYLHTYLGVPLDKALLINSFVLLLNITTLPFIGMLSDRYGRKPILILGAIGFCLFSYPLFLFILSGKTFSILIGQSVLAILLCFVTSVAPAVLVELFPTNIRYTAVSFPYNVANSVFGGTAPMVVAYLIANTGSLLAPSFYLIAASIVMLMILLNIRETYQLQLA